VTQHHPPPDRGLTFIGIGGMALLAVNGFAGGFDHTVKLARLNGAGAYWDISTAGCIEVLAAIGSILLVVFHRRGWSTRDPMMLIVVGVLATFAAQIAYRASAEPNDVIGFIVAVTPTATTLLALRVGHTWYELATAPPVRTPEPGVVGAATPPPTPYPAAVPDDLPEATAVPEAPRTRAAVPETEPVPVPEVPRTPTPVPGPADRASTPPKNPGSTPVASTDPAEYEQQLQTVRAMPVNKQTGMPSVRAIMRELSIGQTRATKIQNEAFPEIKKESEARTKITKEKDNREVTERDSGESEAEGGEGEDSKTGTGTIATFVDQGPAVPEGRPVDGAEGGGEVAALRLVGGAR